MSKKSSEKVAPRKPPLHVPLSFEQLTDNIFKVDPKKLPASARPGAGRKNAAPRKKRAAKKAAR